MHGALLLGVPDMLFGLSAIPVFRRARRGGMRPRALATWHLVGFGVVFLPGELVIQSGLPGPIYWYTAQPDSLAFLQFPMAFGPTAVVPLLLLMNLLCAWRSGRSG
jgi:hypothetical protein